MTMRIAARRAALGALGLSLAVAFGAAGAFAPAAGALAPGATHTAGSMTTTGTTAGSTTTTGTPAAEPTARSFGALLSWLSPTDAQTYATGLGGTPAFYGETLGYPLRSADVQELERVTAASAAQGAQVLIQLAPRATLGDLTTANATALAQTLDTLHQRYATRFVVDFAPEMNGSWQAWGQQPAAFVAAFRTVATAVHTGVPSATTLWEPANGAGYPFRSARGEVTPSGPRITSQLDTNHDGKVTEADDPYGPYWPGAAYVDEVGLADYWYGSPSAFGHNSLPPAGAFAASLQGTSGYSTPTGSGRNFIARFSVATHLPLVVETGALYVPSESTGPSREAIEEAWLRQVFSPTLQAQFPTLRSVMWFEQTHPSAEAGGRTVDWRIADDPAVVATLRSLLRSGGYALGPVPRSSGRAQANGVLAQADQSAGENAAGTTRILVGVIVLLVLFLLSGVVRRFIPAWRYPLERDAGVAHASPIRRVGTNGRRVRDTRGDGRDGRIDLLRGFVMCLVIVTHLDLGGPLTWFSARAGALSGAEMFVLLSGVVLGALYPRLVARQGAYSAAVTMFRRAGRQWVETVVVILAVFFIAKIPGINATSVTTFTDQGTGLGGSAAAGRVYYLYGTAQHLLDYPPPFFALRDLVLLRYGPWPMNIMGLFVVLSLAVPASMWLIRHRMWWLLLAISWGLYALNALHPITVFDAEFEAVFPLLTWQVAFTHGLVIGRYRRQITTALSSRLGLAAITVVLVAYVAALFALHAGFRFGGIPTFTNLYNDWYQRVNLEGGRLVDLALCLIVFTALLTTCWTPLHATLGRVFEPIGRWSLDVFYLQVFFVMFARTIPHLSLTSGWQGLGVGAASIGLALVWSLWRDHRSAPAKPPAPQAAPRRELELSST